MISVKSLPSLFSLFFIVCQAGAQNISTALNPHSGGLPIIPPDSVITSTEDFNNEVSTLPFEQELNPLIYTEQDITDVEEGGEYGEDIFVSTMPAVDPEPVNFGGNGEIKITRKETGENITVRYRNQDGSYNQEALDEIKGIMRSSLEGAEHKIAIKLIELLDAVEDHFGKKGLILLSGYRSKPLNLMTPGAARESLHMLGWASDIRINGYSALKIRNFARKFQAGGVGYYPTMNFVHLDVGRVRYWEVRPHKVRKKKNHPIKKRTYRK